MLDSSTDEKLENFNRNINNKIRNNTDNMNIQIDNLNHEYDVLCKRVDKNIEFNKTILQE